MWAGHTPLRAPAAAALAGVVGERGGAFELGARFVEAAQLGEQVAAHAGQQVVARQRGIVLRARRRAQSPAAGPNAIASATARLSSTTGDGVTSPSASYSADDARPVGLAPRSARARDRRRSRPAGRRGRARRRAPRRAPAPPGRGGSAVGPSAQRSCSSSRIGSPVGPRARARARPGSPSARPGHAPRARPAPARPGCGPGAAPPRTARAASSRRRRWPRSLR